MNAQGKIGFCIGPGFERKDDTAVFEKLKELGTPPLADGLNKFNVVDPGIKPIVSNIKMAGRAVTVRMRPGDNLMLHKVSDYLEEGDVLVVDTCGCTTYCVLGDLIVHTLFKKNIAGIIVDGGIRDVVELREERFPVFARFFTPAVGDKDGPGEINRPVCCGGVPVLPGDYICGDDNGIVVIPQDMLEEVIAGAEKKLRGEAARRKQIEDGILVKPEVEEYLKAKGVI